MPPLCSLTHNQAHLPLVTLPAFLWRDENVLVSGTKFNDCFFDLGMRDVQVVCEAISTSGAISEAIQMHLYPVDRVGF
jgi:hypothetical protein